MSDLSRLSSLVMHIPVYGPCAISRALNLEEDTREMTFEDMESMHPGLFGAN